MQPQEFDPSRQQASPDFAPTPAQETQTQPSAEQLQPVETQTQAATHEMAEFQFENKESQSTDNESFLNKAIGEVRNKLSRKPTKKKQVKLPQIKDDLTKEIEEIMSDGLAEAFTTLSPVEQQEFKLKGEETAFQIRQMMSETKIKVRKIFLLLIEWLRFLPGVNTFYLEQEAKIKADKIMSLHHIRKQ